MDFRKVAIEDLKNLNYLELGIEHNKERIEELKDSSNIDDITARERAELNNRAVIPLVENIKESLDALTETERKVLRRMYIDSERGAVEHLCEELCYEKSMIYRIKDEAIRKFTLAMYGIEAL